MKFKIEIVVDIPEENEVDLLKIINFDPSKEQYHSYFIEDQYMERVMDLIQEVIPVPEDQAIGRWLCDIDMNKYKHFGGK